MRLVIAGLIAIALLSSAHAEGAPAQVPEPWLGTWKLRVEVGEPPRSELVRFEPKDSGYRSIHDSVGPDGKDYPLKVGSQMAVCLKQVESQKVYDRQ